MQVTTVNMFYLGNFADVDVNESGYRSDNAGSLIGDYDRPETIAVTENDANSSQVISDDEGNCYGDSMSYDAGSGPMTLELDSTNCFEARITLGDGTVQTVDVAVLQMTNGDVFVRDLGNNLDNLNIQNFELTRVLNTNYNGSRTGNSIEGTRMVCFARGTKIATPDGEKRVENLIKGDLVVTHDAGPQPIHWISSKTVPCMGRNAPILIPKGALGDGLPTRDLLVSRQHRVLVRSAIAQRMFGHDEVLLPSGRLIGCQGIRTYRQADSVQYWHVLLNEHHILTAEGAPAESLFLGKHVLRTLPMRSVLRFPQVRSNRPGLMSMARYVPSGRQQRSLMRRHMANKKPLLSHHMSHESASLVG